MASIRGTARVVAWTLTVVCFIRGGVVHARAVAQAGDPAGRDAVLDWNSIALQLQADDHTGLFGPAEQPGPGRSARALAMVHLAIFDAVNSIEPRATPY